ncbi:MAG: response regulator transcription factor [Nitrosopumilaceae archaeon]
MIKVIVIDDEADVSEVLCEFLKIKGYQVVGRGNNGKDAFELYKKYSPDIVMMDLVMPKFDGFYGIEKIRQYDPKSKIMIISASLTPSYIRKLLELNVDSISLKPYDLSNVIDLIEKINQGIKVQKVPNIFQRQLNQ